MRYLISVIETKLKKPHSAEEIRAINEFNEFLESKSYHKLAIGIHPPEKSLLIDGRGDEISSINAPLHEGEEFISGIWLIDVPNQQIAEELAAKGSQACNRRVELRQIIG